MSFDARTKPVILSRTCMLILSLPSTISLFFKKYKEDKQMVDLLWKIARMKSGPLADLRDQAYDALTRRVWAPDMHEPLQRELMEMTLVYLKRSSLDTNPRTHMDDGQYTGQSALDLIGFVKTGNREFEGRLYGKDAIAFAENWLKTNK